MNLRAAFFWKINEFVLGNVLRVGFSTTKINNVRVHLTDTIVNTESLVCTTGSCRDSFAELIC